MSLWTSSQRKTVFLLVYWPVQSRRTWCLILVWQCCSCYQWRLLRREGMRLIRVTWDKQRTSWWYWAFRFLMKNQNWFSSLWRWRWRLNRWNGIVRNDWGIPDLADLFWGMLFFFFEMRRWERQKWREVSLLFSSIQEKKMMMQRSKMCVRRCECLISWFYRF